MRWVALEAPRLLPSYPRRTFRTIPGLSSVLCPPWPLLTSLLLLGSVPPPEVVGRKHLVVLEHAHLQPQARNGLDLGEGIQREAKHAAQGLTHLSSAERGVAYTEYVQ